MIIILTIIMDKKYRLSPFITYLLYFYLVPLFFTEGGHTAGSYCALHLIREMAYSMWAETLRVTSEI